MSKQPEVLTDKLCPKCAEIKPISGFYLSKGKPRSYCVECEKADRRDGMKRYNATLRGKAAQALNGSRRSHREAEAETGEVIPNTLTLHEVLFALSSKECVYCQRELTEQEMTLDHAVSMKQGGTNEYKNVLPACIEDNRFKKDKPILDYLLFNCDKDATKRVIDRLAQANKVDYLDMIEILEEQRAAYHRAEIIKKVDKRNEQTRSKRDTETASQTR